MFTRKGLVDRAVTFRGKSPTPFWVTGSRLKQSDILTYDLALSKADDPQTSEWGFPILKEKTGFLAIPEEATLKTWKDADCYTRPQLDTVRRLAGIAKAAQVCEDRYRLATFSLSGFAVYRSLRGKEQSRDDALIETDRFLELFDLIIEQEMKMFDMLTRKGFHAVEFRDNWNIDRMKLSLWRRLLKPRYALQIRNAAELGLQVWFSCPSASAEFFGDLLEIGVNVFRIDSPYIADISSIGHQFAGRAAFAVCLDDLVQDGPIDPERYCEVRGCLSKNGNGFIGHFTEAVPGKIAEKTISALRKLD